MAFDPNTTSISDLTGRYPSTTTITLVNGVLTVISDGDPYPAKAGSTMTNDGVSPRIFNNNPNNITEQDHSFSFTYRGGTNTSNPQRTTLGAIGIATNGVVLFNPNTQAGPLPGSDDIPAPGFTYNAVFNQSSLGADLAGGHPEQSGEYHYHSGKFLSDGWNHQKVSQANDYYNSSNFNNDKFRHPDGHSKIIGYCFDGYPVYGPFGYTIATDSTSGVSQQLSSYRTKTNEASGRGYSYQTKPAGTFVNDYEYILNAGTLDSYNGRFCVTPEYPNGTYAYFLTYESGNLSVPAYPYIFGEETKQVRQTQMLVPSSTELPEDVLWTVGNNHSLGTFQEAITQTIPLPVNSVDSLTLIGGELPGGLRIENNLNLVGTPYEVKLLKTFTFVLRARKGNNIEDRTLSLTIDGADAPQWITNEGSLPLGPNNAFYILDSSPVDFQLQLIDPDLPAGDRIEYYIGENDGELPPGIELGRTTGKLTGVVEPVLALEKRAGSGYFDTNSYGNYPFDFGVKSFNGFESFYYDTTFYDYAVPTQSPKKLNRYYEFTVSASDGVVIAKRKFQIYLVGDDFLRTDNTIMQVGTGLFTADNTFLRAPVWLTPGDLGFRRANNYVTLFLDVYDPTSNQGIISFSVKPANPDGTASALPPGMALDSTNGEIAGRIPYQPAVTKEYKFTVEALRQLGSATSTSTQYFANNIGVAQEWSGENNVPFFNFAEAQFVGGNDETGWIVFNEVGVTEADASDNPQYVASNIVGKKVWVVSAGRVIATFNDSAVTTIDVGFEDYIRDTFVGTVTDVGYRTFDKAGQVTANKVVTMSFYNFTKRTTSETNRTVAKDKTFSVKLLGEVESTINWNTDSALGNLRANFVSTLSVSASSNVPNAVLIYTLDSGRLPPGITLGIDGQLQGKIRQFGTTGLPGLTTIDKATGAFTLDGATTTIDRSYTFTVKAQDQFGFSATTRTFTITTTDPDDLLYSNISMIPLLKQNDRTTFRNFISDPTIFTPESIYRPNDSTFGLQDNIKVLAYAGIETKDVRDYVAAAARNHKRKKYKFGAIKKAIAKNPGSNDTVYEVIYLDLIDPAEPTAGKTALTFDAITKNKITVDSVQFAVTDDNTGVGTGEGFFDIVLRGGSAKSPASTGTVTLFARTGPILFAPGNAIPLILQNGSKIVVANIDDSINSDPIRLRPETNTIKIDSNAINVSESKDQKKYISNISNMRERIRAVGNNLREFYPLWMRTAQSTGEAELGYVLAVPLCYCKPGQADSVILNIKNSGFDFKNINIEIDRYNIDSTNGNSNEQYIPFANYQFNV
tara:strand:- start:446 stop:4357 length:3912 start_codon:yes stop_codon:yes gene_type:complete